MSVGGEYPRTAHTHPPGKGPGGRGTHPPTPVDIHTPVKTLPSPNLLAGGSDLSKLTA